MFYSQFILAKKGPLGTIWIAAHLERKLRKNQVADTDIGVSVDSILFPEVPIALRLSSHLLLGVVRIYSKKVNYLFDDCSEALLKVKQAFRSTAVDLPPEESTAPYHSITLPETFDLDDFELPDNEIFQGNFVDHHISSREQITLQDRMEGVVYSTSQFGLDERFGDGDTSGLDLDEELFLDKVAAAGHADVMLNSVADPQTSAEIRTQLKEDGGHEAFTANSETLLDNDNINQIDAVDGGDDFFEYAQAPCTPGLVEEPNLSNAQETFACDDHPETENHNSTELTAKEIMEKFSSKSDLYHGNENLVDGSLLNNLNPLTVPDEENGYHPDEPEFDQVKPLGRSPTALASDRNVSASGDLHEVQDLPHEIVSNEPDNNLLRETREDHASQGVRLGESIPTDISSLTSTCQPISENVSANNKASSVTEVSNNVEVAGNMGISCSLGDGLGSNAECHDTPNFEKPTASTNLGALHEEMECTTMHVLRVCNTHLNQDYTCNNGGDFPADPEIATKVSEFSSSEAARQDEADNAPGASPVVQGEGCHADGPEHVLEENHVTDTVSCEAGQMSSGILNGQVDKLISGDGHLENSNRSSGSDLPAPEKMRSVPDGHADVPNTLLLEGTPGQGALALGDGGKTFSGKKRSFTESALTVQSLNSVQSLGVFDTKRTAESVPDDDDLLSSILVGRKSSVLKVKSTPEIPLTKRHRSAHRTTASKRKLLMDDPMVLHGDTIRLQLTNTEDIRRIRKKAPCTRPEISMIQKQFWEDEIFSEPVFNGVSLELASLHNQTYDLSQIRISPNEVNEASFDVAKKLNLTSENDDNRSNSEVENVMNTSVGPNFTEETRTEWSRDPLVVTGNGKALPVETPIPFETQQCEDHTINLDETSDVTEPRSSHHKLLGEATAVEIDGKNISHADAVISTVNGGHQPFCPPDLVSGDSCEKLVGLIHLDSFEKSCEEDATIHMNEPGVSPHSKLDMLSAEMDGNDNRVDANEVLEDMDEGIAVVVTESRIKDGFLLEEETEGGALVENGIGRQTDYLPDFDHANPSASLSSDIAGCSTQVVTIDQAMEGMEKNKENAVSDSEILDAELECRTKNSICNGTFGEEPIVDSSYPTEVDFGLKRVSLDDGEYTSWPEANSPNMADVGVSAIGRDDYNDFDYSAAGHDTEFLNVDDDEVAEADVDCNPSAEETEFLDNSGWSSRTRAVAKYLQTLFEKEAERGRKVIPIDNLLAGKTRKEASRMFFEALVLKTKDYIDVKQENPFDNINVLPRAKLMKSDF